MNSVTRSNTGAMGLWRRIENRRGGWLRASLPLLLISLLTCGCQLMKQDSEVVHVDGQPVFGDSSREVNQALHFYRKGKLDLAADKFEQALAIEPDNGAAHNNLGLIYYEQRKLVLAADHFDAALRLLPEDARPINSLGMTLEAGGRVMEAIDLYEQASLLEPNNPLYLGNAVRARVRLGEHSDQLIEQLRHLAFIETRPEWLSWADEQLAVHRNPMLDRGPSNTSLSGPNRQRPGGRISDQSEAAAESTQPVPWTLAPDGMENLPVPEPRPPSQ